MGKNEKRLLLIGILGTLVILGMAFADRWLYEGDLPPGMVATIPVEEADAEDNEGKPEAASEAELPEDATLFSIDPLQSEARFTLGEVLGGVPTTVVGVSSGAEGMIAIPMGEPQGAYVGEILINARGFATDNDLRNRAVHSRILESGAYGTISFVPKEITLLPDVISFGESVTLEILGDLTIKGRTHEVLFTAEVTMLSETEVQGHAEAMVAYADYGISIPSVPRVADVDDEVLLEIDFVAVQE